MLSGDPTYAINFDRIQFDPDLKTYIIFEFLLCEEDQFVTPYTSHPRRYWNKNKQKFISLWRITQKLNAVLSLVNYAKKGTEFENEVLAIKVLELDNDGIRKEQVKKFTREEFKEWFRKKNRKCSKNNLFI